MDDRPIGVFDSGFGGLTVARALIDLLPDEHLIYVGDTGRYPYGSKPQEDVRAYSHEITKWLIDTHDVKLVVVACNTASAAALTDLQATYDTPIVGVIDAGVRSLLQVSESNVGRDVVLVSSADETAFQVRSMLLEHGGTRVGPQRAPLFLSSGDIDEFARIGSMLLGPELESVGRWAPTTPNPAEGSGNL